MKRVFKYQLPETHVFDLELPAEARILTFQLQFETPYIWALVDEDAAIEKRHFVLLGTGDMADTIDDDSTYIGTTQLYRGRVDAHLFEVTKRGA